MAIQMDNRRHTRNLLLFNQLCSTCMKHQLSSVVAFLGISADRQESKLWLETSARNAMWKTLAFTVQLQLQKTVLVLQQISAKPLQYGGLKTWALFVILLLVSSLSMVKSLHQLWILLPLSFICIVSPAMAPKLTDCSGLVAICNFFKLCTSSYDTQEAVSFFKRWWWG